jgi:hypothetical protein
MRISEVIVFLVKFLFYVMIIPVIYPYIHIRIFNINIIHRNSNDTAEYALKVKLSRLIGFATYYGYPPYPP